MDATERAELRRVAEAATPGPWETVPTVGNAVVSHNGQYLDWSDVADRVETEADAEHIATFDPNAVLQLLDEIDRVNELRTVALSERDQSRRMRSRAERERDEARAVIERVRELHRDAGPSQGYGAHFRGDYGEYDSACASCGSHGEYGVPWPCPTIRALDGDTSGGEA